LTIAKAIHLEFGGAHGTISSALPGSYLIKKATMTTPALTFSVPNSRMTGGGVVGQAGNTGDNILIAGNSVRLSHVTSIAAGRDGIRIGNDTDGGNMNQWYLESCFAHSNGQHGFHISDGTSTANTDANAGTSINCSAMSNAGDGMRINFAMHNAIIGFVGESNTGYGLWLKGAFNQVYGGDRESNTAGQLYIPDGAVQNKLWINNSEEVVDAASAAVGSSTVRGERYIAWQGTWTPVIYGDSVAGTNTYAYQYGRWYRDGDYVQVDCNVKLTALEVTLDGSVFISGLPFAYPAG
jgi:hypothetical protein